VSTAPNADPDPAGDRYPGMPTWVKRSLIAVIVVLVVLVLVRAVAGGDHGPGMHMSTTTSPVVLTGHWATP
jgi:hypothetical protein